MKHLLLPDYDFDTYKGVTPEFLKSIGKTCVLCDIDNTLVPYDVPSPTDDVITWAKQLTDSGIKLILVSNNNKERVELFNKALQLPAYYKAGKPFKKNLLNALNDMHSEVSHAAVMGDQIFTDVCAGKFNGMRAILVPPIKDKTSLFFRFKRALEKPVLKYYFKKIGK